MSIGVANPTVPVGRARFTMPLAVVVRAPGGHELARHEVRDSELNELRSEFWLELYLRQGLTEVPVAALLIDVVPQFRGDATTFRLTARGPHDRRLERDYDADLLRDAATAMVQELLMQQRLQLNDAYTWHVVPSASPAAPSTPATTTPPFSLTSASPPLTFVTLPLAPLIARSESHGPVDDQELKVFFVRTALERAERFARRGADRQPAVETGAAYVGVLASCPDSGDFYVVVTDALEVFDAQQQEFSLTYNSETWSRIRGILQARRNLPGGAALRILGQCHGHNFLPGGGAPPCELCAKTAVCSRTSVFVSSDDRRWTRAVMSGQPWQLCHIFGFNARKEYLSELFGLRGNRLEPRGYYVIDRFELSS